MEIFNKEETKKLKGEGPVQCIIFLTRQEAKTLGLMVEAASEANPRKKTWKAVNEKIRWDLGCY